MEPVTKLTFHKGDIEESAKFLATIEPGIIIHNAICILLLFNTEYVISVPKGVTYIQYIIYKGITVKENTCIYLIIFVLYNLKSSK
jgi:hypothetical protein